MAADSNLQIPLRREFKYLVAREQIPALRAGLQGLCRRDPHAGPDGTYRLRSLYLDTPDLRLFHANEREAVRRFKARIRTYPDARQAPVISEIKDRSGDVIRKIRGILPQDDWPSFFVPGGLSAEADPAVEVFSSRVLRHDLRPVCLVEYYREAWVSEWDEYARVSIDTRIQCQSTHEWTLDPRGSWRPIDHALLSWTTGSVCVVELKWAEVPPMWMIRLVQQLDLLRHSFSKYCYSMASLSEDHYRDYRRASSIWA